MSAPETIKIDDIEYIRKDKENKDAEKLNGLPYMIVRTYSAGVFVGYVKRIQGKEAVIFNARRIWRWAGAASLSQLAVEGTANPSECKFTIPVSEILVTEAIEFLTVTQIAKKNIDGVPAWKV